MTTPTESAKGLTREQIEEGIAIQRHRVGEDVTMSVKIYLDLCGMALRSLEASASATVTPQEPVALSEDAILKALYASNLGVRPLIYESCKDGICIDRTTVQVDNFVKAIIKLAAPVASDPEERRTEPYCWVIEWEDGRQEFVATDPGLTNSNNVTKPLYE